MRKLVFALLAGVTIAAGAEGIVQYQATAKNTPCTGYAGRVVGVQFASTNSTATATISAVTDLQVGGNVASFTNQLATATLVDGMANVAPTNTFVAPGQRIVVSGTAFPGGSAIVWIER